MKFVNIGDCCVDSYPDKQLLGGMAYNSAVAASLYGVTTSIVSTIGNDENGLVYKRAFEKYRIDASHTQISNKPTSIVEITLDESKSPLFGKWELGALTDWKLTKKDLAFIQRYDIAKSVLLKPYKKNFSLFCETPMPYTLKAGDFDGATPYSYESKEIEKYIEGLDIAIKSLDIKDKDEIEFLQKLAKRKNKIILVTLGENGSICFTGDKTYRQHAEKIRTTNTTGFGDTFLAVFLIEYCKTKNIQHAMLGATKMVVKLNNRAM